MPDFDPRVSNLEQSLRVLTDQVTRLAGAMERVAVMEERNQNIIERLNRQEGYFQSRFDDITKVHSETQNKLDELNARVIWWIACSMTVLGIANFVGPYVIRSLLG